MTESIKLILIRDPCKKFTAVYEKILIYVLYVTYDYAVQHLSSFLYVKNI